MSDIPGSFSSTAISLGLRTVPCKREPSLQKVIACWSRPTSFEKDREDREDRETR